MNARRLFSLALVLILLATLTGAAGSAPLAGPCVPGSVYNSACDANQDGQITVTDIQLTGGHWNQNGTFVSDSNHTHLGQTWTGANNPIKIQGSFGTPDYAPLLLSNNAGDGLRISSAGGSAVYVSSATNSGVAVSSTYDGLYVNSATHDGLVVGSVGQDGVYVNSAYNGVHVGSVDLYGVYVGSAAYGVAVGSAGDYGVSVESAGNLGVYANTTQATGQWGFYTPDRIFGTIGMFSAVSLVAQVSGPDSLTAGDMVAVAGVADPLPDSTAQMPLVRLADGTFDGVIGVVESRLALTSRPSQPPVKAGETPAEPEATVLRNADGPAQAGDYVGITVLGAAQVKVDRAAVIETGQRLTVSSQPGHARALRTLKVQLAGDAGTADLPEGAPVIGVAMGPAQDGLVWVMVNPQ